MNLEAMAARNSCARARLLLVHPTAVFRFNLVLLAIAVAAFNTLVAVHALDHELSSEHGSAHVGHAEHHSFVAHLMEHHEDEDPLNCSVAGHCTPAFASWALHIQKPVWARESSWNLVLDLQDAGAQLWPFGRAPPSFLS